MRMMLAAALYSLSMLTAAAPCPTMPPPPATPAWAYYDAADRAVWDAAVISMVAGTAAEQVQATNIAYVLLQARRFTFEAFDQLNRPWSDDETALFSAIASSALEGAAGKPNPARAADYSPIVAKASAQARIVMDFRKTRLCERALQ